MTIADRGGLSITSAVGVVVDQTLTSIVVTPLAASLSAGQTQQFTAVARDQFNQNMATQPAFSWTATAGTITTTGLYTAPQASAVATVTATAGAVTGTPPRPPPTRPPRWSLWPRRGPIP